MSAFRQFMALSIRASVQPTNGSVNVTMRADESTSHLPSYAALKKERVARQRHRTVDIIVCVHNALDFVTPCLASVRPTLGPNHRLLVIDDASSADVGEHLREWSRRDSRIIVLRNPRQLGYTRAANIGLRESKADFVILLNSDTLVAPDWIEKLCDAIYSIDRPGIIGPLSNAASAQSLPDNHATASQTAINPLPQGWSVADMDRWCEAQTQGTTLPRVPLVHGFCFGIARPVIETIGVFDEILFPDGYGEENDYCLRAADAGFDLVVATHTFVFHAKTKSYSPAHREKLAAAADVALRTRYSDARVDRAIATLNDLPILAALRTKAAGLYR